MVLEGVDYRKVRYQLALVYLKGSKNIIIITTISAKRNAFGGTKNNIRHNDSKICDGFYGRLGRNQSVYFVVLSLLRSTGINKSKHKLHAYDHSCYPSNHMSDNFNKISQLGGLR